MNLQNGFHLCPDIADKLRSKCGRALDVGCGERWTSISLDKSFPLTKVDAVDADSQSIDNAKKNVYNTGLENRNLYINP